MFQWNRLFLMRRLATAMAVVAASFISQSVLAQGLNYVDANHVSPMNLGPPAAIGFIPTEENIDNLWRPRQDFGSKAPGPDGTAFDGIGVYESNVTGLEDSPELTMTLSGLPAGTYDLYGVFWTDDDENWTLQAGTTSGNLNSYSYAGSRGFNPITTVSTTLATTAGAAIWDTLPPPTLPGSIFTDRTGNPLVMLLGYAGTVVADGSSDISVFIDDLPGQGGGRRSWFDGVAYVAADTTIALEAEINRNTGELTITNPTNRDFDIKSITIDSARGALDATQWTPITGRLDGNGDSSFDSDPWNINLPIDPPASTPFALSLSEAEIVTGDGLGGVLTAAGGTSSTISFGNIWNGIPIEDVVVRLIYGDEDVMVGEPGELDDELAIIYPTFTGDFIPTGSLDGDADIGTDDYQILLDNLNSSVAGLSFAERYQRGDLTGDNLVDFYDFQAFRVLYNDANGAGSFEQIAATVPEPSSLAMLLGMGVLALGYVRRRSAKLCAACMMFGLLTGVAGTANAIDIAVDIDSTRLSGDNTTGVLATQSGFTSWDLTNVGTSGSTIAIDGVTFEVFGFIGANQSRVRAGGGGGPYNDLLRDFVFNEGANGRAVGLRIFDLPVGIYHMRSWHWDGVNAVDATRVNIRDQGVAGSTKTVANNVLWRPIPIPYILEVTNPTPAKEVVFVESSTSNRSRLNAFKIEDFAGLTLEVTTNTGAMRFLNEQSAAVDMSYYEIRSDSGQLVEGNWTSLDSTEGNDPVGTGWDEITNTNEFILSEANLQSLTSFAQSGMTSDSFDLGNAFMPNGTEDLRFYYTNPADEFLQAGLIRYISTGAALAGDYNNDGTVNAADYTVWRDNLGGSGLPNDDTPGTVDQSDYDVWVANFGNSAGSGSGSTAAIPEPTSLGLLGIAAVLLGIGYRRRQR